MEESKEGDRTLNIALRDYQEEAIKGVSKIYRSGKKSALMVLPCGGGKTRTASKIIHGAFHKNKKANFCTHRKEILQQTSNTFWEYGIDHSLIVSGGKSYGKDIKVSMVQTLVNRLGKVDEPDIIIFDEAHLSRANTWVKVRECFPDALLLGLTATPCRLDGKPLGDMFDEMYVGPQTYEMIKMGHLCRFVLYRGSCPDISKAKILCGDISKKSAGEAADKKVLIGDAVKNYKEKGQGKPAIVFCVNTSHAIHTKEAFNASGYKFEIVSGDKKITSSEERARYIKQLGNGEINGIVSVDCLSEGTDIPLATVAIDLAPTLSLAKYLQRIGRVLRTHPEKEYAIILDHAGNTHRHGMPDDHREWSLDSKIKQTRNMESDSSEAWRECPQCFGYIPQSETVCPQCGAEYKVKTPDMIETVEGELELVVSVSSEEFIKAERISSLASKGIGNMTPEELREYGKLKGYKSGWAWMQLQRRKQA